MDASILVLDSTAVNALARNTGDNTTEPSADQEAFGGVLDDQVQAQDIPLAQMQHADVAQAPGAAVTAISPQQMVMAVSQSPEVSLESDHSEVESSADITTAIFRKSTEFAADQIDPNAVADSSVTERNGPVSGLLVPGIPAPLTAVVATIADSALSDPARSVNTQSSPLAKGVQGTPLSATIPADGSVASGQTGLPQGGGSEPSAQTIQSKLVGPTEDNSGLAAQVRNTRAAVDRSSTASPAEASPAMPDSDQNLKSAVQGTLVEQAQNKAESRPGSTPAAQHLSSVLAHVVPAQSGVVLSTQADGSNPPLPQALPALQQPLTDSHWNNAFGQRIVWALGQGVQSASLDLKPAELGPVSVQITVQDDLAKLNFTAAHGQVREAIEAALPRLRDMLQSSGITMGQVTVGDDAQTQAGHYGDQQQNNASVFQDSVQATAADAAQRTGTTQYVSHGLVDTFV